MIDFFTNMVDKVRNDFTFWDIGLLKTYGAIPGLILGAFFPEFVKQNLWVFIFIFGVIFIPYIYVLFFKKTAKPSISNA